MRNKAKQFCIAVLGLIALQIVDCGIAEGQTVGYMMLNRGVGATTICSEKNEPVIVIARQYKGSTFETELRAHEMVHVRQMNEYPGGCEAATARYMSDPQFRFDQEFEAYCQNAVQQVRAGEPLIPTAQALALHMMLLYPDVYQSDVIEAKAVMCAEEP